MKSESELLASRYGKAANGARVSRRNIILLATFLVILFLGWAVWVSVSNAGNVKSQVLGYEVLSPAQTSVKFSVESPAGAAKCAIQVLNQAYGVVGYKEVEVDASGEFETIVNTTELGVTGLVDKCWVSR